MTSPPDPLSVRGEGEQRRVSISPPPQEEQAIIVPPSQEPTGPQGPALSPSPPEERGPGGEVHWHTSPALWEQLKPLARQMRHQPTRAEDLLWQALRGSRLAGLRFRRQHAINQFIVDFYCREKHLIVEADGPVHDHQETRDEARDHILTTLGFRVLRFANEEIVQDLDRVLDSIHKAAFSPAPPDIISPSPPEERGPGGEV